LQFASPRSRLAKRLDSRGGRSPKSPVRLEWRPTCCSWSKGRVSAPAFGEALLVIRKLAFGLVAAAALLLPLTDAPEPVTWIACLTLLIVLGAAVARPSRRGRLPPGIA
jgi:hypothetical protein